MDPKKTRKKPTFKSCLIQKTGIVLGAISAMTINILSIIKLTCDGNVTQTTEEQGSIE